MSVASHSEMDVETPQRALEVHLLGCVEFSSLVELQRIESESRRLRSDDAGTIFFCEHPAVISVGRHGSREQIGCDDDELTSRGLETVWVNRGGGAILHSPGQLAGYVILELGAFGLSPIEFRDHILAALQTVSAEFHVGSTVHHETASIVARRGVIAEVGVSIRNGVTRFGFYFNVSPELRSHRLIRPLVRSERISSLSHERQAYLPMSAVRESVMRALTTRLGANRTFTFTGHPLLRRVSGGFAHA